METTSQIEKSEYCPDLNDPVFLNFIESISLFSVSITDYKLKYFESCEILYTSSMASQVYKVYNNPESLVSLRKLSSTWRETYKTILYIDKKNISHIDDLEKFPDQTKDENKHFTFNPGDALGIIPINTEKEINEVLNLFAQNKRLRLHLENKSFNYTGNIYELLMHIELYGIPTKKFCKEFYNLLIEAQCFQTNQKLKYLRFLISKEGESYYMKLTQVRLISFLKYFLIDSVVYPESQGCNTVDLESKQYEVASLDDQENSMINLWCQENKTMSLKFFSLFLKYSEKNKPRFYSICDYDKPFNKIELLVGIEKTFHGYGLISSLISSNYLIHKEAPHKIRNNLIYRPSKLLDFPAVNTDEKILFICTGTGIASFIFQIRKMSHKQFICLYGFREKEDNLIQYFNLNERYEKQFVLLSSKIMRINNFLQVYNKINKVAGNVPILIDSEKTVKREMSQFIELLGDLNKIKRVYLCGSNAVMANIYQSIKEWEVVRAGKVFFDSWQ
ncbi:hypothetical protein CDIK_1506 [Cucumispora dikerogammari]|nr:hypothetical protein CDIK_1506 [Cucumispora dikerogammari]